MRRLPLLAIGVLVLTASCTSTDPEVKPTPSADDPPDTVSSAEPGDDGAVEIGDQVFTPVPGSDGRAAVFAVEITNTSETDLLYYSDIAVTWSGEGAEQTEPTNRVNYVLPGETAMIGEFSEFDFAVEDMDVAVDQERWYPAENLEELGVDLRTGIEQQEIDPDEDEIRAAVEFTTHHDKDEYQNELYARLVMRDADGELLGCAVAAEFLTANSAGTHQEDIEFDGDQWLEAADVDESHIALDWHSGFGLAEP